MSSKALWDKYRPFVNKVVVVTAPAYAVNEGTDESQIVTGKVLGLAWRETGVMVGRTYDMVVLPGNGPLRTIALSRIVNCREVDAGATGSYPGGE